MKALIQGYTSALKTVLDTLDLEAVCKLGDAVKHAWVHDNQVFLCGNGGSAGNATHLANDFVCGIEDTKGAGARATSLAANVSILTALANDIAYKEIFAKQLEVSAKAQDVLIVMSGSGNSPNVIQALMTGNRMGMQTFAIVGYDGGACRELAGCVIHTEIDDMQIAEDMQLVIGHMIMQYLKNG